MQWNFQSRGDVKFSQNTKKQRSKPLKEINNIQDSNPLNKA